MALRGVCGQLTDDFGFGQLSAIYQIIVNHQAVEAALQANWFHQIKSPLFVTNNFYFDTSTSRTSRRRETTTHGKAPFFFALRALYVGCILRDNISLLVQVLYTCDYAQWSSIDEK